MRPFVAVLAALVMAGCADPVPANDGDDGEDRLARLPTPPDPFEFRLLAWDALDLDSTSAVTVPLEVPEQAIRMLVLWQADEGVYQGPVQWTGLGGCDGRGGTSGATVGLGRNNGSSAVGCDPPAPGPAEATLEVAAGSVRGTFTVVVVVATEAAAGNVTIPLPGP